MTLPICHHRRFGNRQLWIIKWVTQRRLDRSGRIEPTQMEGQYTNLSIVLRHARRACWEPSDSALGIHSISLGAPPVAVPAEEWLIVSSIARKWWSHKGVRHLHSLVEHIKLLPKEEGCVESHVLHVLLEKKGPLGMSCYGSGEFLAWRKREHLVKNQQF